MIHNALLNIDVASLIDTYGPVFILIVCGLLFAETGLLFGFFLPGDTILFPTGLALATGGINFPLWAALLLFAGSAWLGDQTGYWLGRKVGPAIFKRPDSKFFKHENVDRAHAFFERYGAKAIILAHFVPVMRTFIPIAAGVGEMSYNRYLRYNAVGVLLWSNGVTLLGAGLGQFAIFRDHVEIVTIVFLVLSTIPLITEYVKARRERSKTR